VTESVDRHREVTPYSSPFQAARRRPISTDSYSSSLPTWADRRHTFERVAASLRPAGRFAWNAFAFDHRIAAGLDGERQEEPVPHTNRYAVGDNRIDLVLDNGATSSIWWATKNEWLGLLDVAGLELEALYGGFAREPFTDGSPEYVFIARRGRSSSAQRLTADAGY
jgi:hypothetical protein